MGLENEASAGEILNWPSASTYGKVAHMSVAYGLPQECGNAPQMLAALMSLFEKL